jgi:3-oxoacyl-(acyl-carrier-protein) reductase
MVTIAVHPERGISIQRPLEGKTALITGSSRGIGRAIAMELAHLGASIAVNFRASRSTAEVLRDDVHELGCNCELFQEDVSDRQHARKLVAVVVECFHRIDILVNNAGITRDHSIAKMTDDEWLEVINTNLNSAFYCTSAAVPQMIEQKYGRIVNIASFVGQAGNFGQANYAASKAGLIGLTKVLALELAKYNITANVVAPGFTDTEMAGAIPPEIRTQIVSRIPLKRFAQPEEIANAVAFLICKGDYITGQQINVNGGIYM